MLCGNPYVKLPQGATRQWRVNKDVRDAMTPFGCGKCPACRINKAREWSHRMLLEMYDSPESLFATFTYSDDFLPSPPQVSKHEFQKLIKRIRKNGNVKISYYGCGEYGTRFDRPHYHAAIFGLGVGDIGLLERSWKKGHVHVGELNHKTARYMTDYIVKGIQREGCKELEGLNPEFSLKSKGLGKNAVFKIAKKLKGERWFKPDRVYRELSVTGKKYPLGRYLTRVLSEALEIPQSVIYKELYDYQEEIFEKNFDGEKSYYCNLVEEKEQERKIQEKRRKIYGCKKTI